MARNTKTRYQSISKAQFKRAADSKQAGRYYHDAMRDAVRASRESDAQRRSNSK